MDGRGGGSGGRFDEGAEVAGMEDNDNKIGKNSGGMKFAHTS